MVLSCLVTHCVFVEFTTRRSEQSRSPVVKVTANTSLSALPAQYTIHRQLSQHTHTCHVCIVWWGMTSTHTHRHTNTPKQLQHGQSPGPAGTNGVSWELTACPAALKSHTYMDRMLRKCAVATNITLKNLSPKKLKRHLSSHFYKNRTPVSFFSLVMALSWQPSPQMSWVFWHQSRGNRTSKQLQSRGCESMRQGSIQRRCVCAAGTCGWRSVSRSHTGTSSLQSVSAGVHEGWSDQQRPGYSADKQRDVHLIRREKTVNFRKNKNNDHSLCLLNELQITL